MIFGGTYILVPVHVLVNRKIDKEVLFSEYEQADGLRFVRKD